MSDTSHVVTHDGTHLAAGMAECQHCGETLDVFRGAPVPVSTLSRRASAFIDAHADCPAPSEGVHPQPPERAPLRAYFGAIRGEEWSVLIMAPDHPDARRLARAALSDLCEYASTSLRVRLTDPEYATLADHVLYAAHLPHSIETWHDAAPGYDGETWEGALRHVLYHPSEISEDTA